jgi:hypothetical protein
LNYEKVVHHRLVHSRHGGGVFFDRALPCLISIAMEKNPKNLLMEALEKTGDHPEDVVCIYSKVWPPAGEPAPKMPQCSAADLPDGELMVLRCRSDKHVYTLVKTDTETKIKTSQY